MHRMATVLAKVKLLKKEVQLREKKRKEGGSDKLGAAGDKRAAHIATANALLTKAKQLEAKALTIRQFARRRYVPDYKNLEQAGLPAKARRTRAGAPSPEPARDPQPPACMLTARGAARRPRRSSKW